MIASDDDVDAASAQNIEDKKINLQYIFADSLMQMLGSKPECASGRTDVRSDRMNGAADAADAQNIGKNKKKAGDHLLSHTASRAVPSTQKSLTSEFGMGSGMASSLLSPARLKKRFRNIKCSIYIFLASPPPSQHFRSEGAGRRLSRTTD